MTPIVPHITAFLRERLPLQHEASHHTCESYAYAFQLLFGFARARFKVTPSQLALEQIESSLVTDFLADIESGRGNCARTRNTRLAAIKSFMRYVEHRCHLCLNKACAFSRCPLRKPTLRRLAICRFWRYKRS